MVGGEGTDRLWVTQPARTTCLARVLQVRGQEFRVDRSLFAPSSNACRHPQPRDAGVVWLAGSKRRLAGIRVHAKDVWYRLASGMPAAGAQVQCQLDQPRRRLCSRAHTAMHLVLAASAIQAGPPLRSDPVVQGGGTFRLDFARPVVPPLLAALVAQANDWIRQDKGVAREHVLRLLAPRSLDAQAFDPPDLYPGPQDVLPVVRIEGVCAYPCDGTHVPRTGQVGMVRVQAAPLGRHGVVFDVRGTTDPK